MPNSTLLHEELTGSVIGAFYEVYNTLGYGFLESVYRRSLVLELRARGHAVSTEVAVRVAYKGIEVGRQRIDTIVDDNLIVEIKSTAVLPRAARRQLLSYLRGSGLDVGRLLHFGPEPTFYRQVCELSRPEARPFGRLRTSVPSLDDRSLSSPASPPPAARRR